MDGVLTTHASAMSATTAMIAASVSRAYSSAAFYRTVSSSPTCVHASPPSPPPHINISINTYRAGFIDGAESILPILSVGDVNVTSSNFHDTLSGAGALLVVATSRSCHRCIHLEKEYQSATPELKEAGVSFQGHADGRSGNRLNLYVVAVDLATLLLE